MNEITDIDNVIVRSATQKWRDRILLDVEGRGLVPGDAYLTADRVAGYLGCSRTTAHRAMKELVDQGVLAARPGSGTFIGPKARRLSPQVQALQILMPLGLSGFAGGTGASLIQLAQSVSGNLGGLPVQFNTYPAGINLDYFSETVLKPFREGQVAAVVTIGCHWTIHRYLKDQGIGALAVGSMFPDRQFLPSIDKDSVQGAELLVSHLIEKGHQRFGMVVPASGLAGVDFFVDAASRSFAAHGVTTDSLILRYCNGDVPVTMDRLRELLNSPQRPTALITDGKELADLAASSAASLGLSVPGDVEIVFEGSLLQTGYSAPYTHTCPVLRHEELATELSRLIRDLKAVENAPRLVPVHLVKASPNHPAPQISAKP